MMLPRLRRPGLHRLYLDARDLYLNSTMRTWRGRQRGTLRRTQQGRRPRTATAPPAPERPTLSGPSSPRSRRCDVPYGVPDDNSFVFREIFLDYLREKLNDALASDALSTLFLHRATQTMMTNDEVTSLITRAPIGGGELGKKAVVQLQGTPAIANLVAAHRANWKHGQQPTARWDSTGSFGTSGSLDLATTHEDDEEVASLIEHKPWLSLRDLLSFLKIIGPVGAVYELAVDSSGTPRSLSDHQEVGLGMRKVLAQVSLAFMRTDTDRQLFQGFYSHKRRRIIFGSRDHYVLMYLSSSDVVTVSPMFVRDPLVNGPLGDLSDATLASLDISLSSNERRQILSEVTPLQVHLALLLPIRFATPMKWPAWFVASTAEGGDDYGSGTKAARSNDNPVPAEACADVHPAHDDRPSAGSGCIDGGHEVVLERMLSNGLSIHAPQIFDELETVPRLVLPRIARQVLRCPDDSSPPSLIPDAPSPLPSVDNSSSVSCPQLPSVSQLQRPSSSPRRVADFYRSGTPAHKEPENFLLDSGSARGEGESKPIAVDGSSKTEAAEAEAEVINLDLHRKSNVEQHGRVHVSINDVLPRGRTYTAFRGTLTTANFAADVVLKFAGSPFSSESEQQQDESYLNPEQARARAENEALLMCGPLRHLQGSVIPHFFGLWSIPGARSAQNSSPFLLVIQEYLAPLRGAVP